MAMRVLCLQLPLPSSAELGTEAPPSLLGENLGEEGKHGHYVNNTLMPSSVLLVLLISQRMAWPCSGWSVAWHPF